MQKKLNIYLAGPRGFCAGVDRAIEMVKGALKKYGSPVYVRHEIVHNKFVVENLKSQGAIFVEELNEIQDKSRPVIFSAHGVPKTIPKEALSLNLVYYDATCPLVSKIHKEVENFDKKNLPVILIGHRNHPEVIGTMGQTDKKIHLVEKVEDVKKLPFNQNDEIAWYSSIFIACSISFEKWQAYAASPNVVKIGEEYFLFSFKDERKKDLDSDNFENLDILAHFLRASSHVFVRMFTFLGTCRIPSSIFDSRFVGIIVTESKSDDRVSNSGVMKVSWRPIG